MEMLVRYAHQRPWRKFWALMGRFFKRLLDIFVMVTVFVGLVFMYTLYDRDFALNDMELYQKDVVQCLEDRSSMFELDKKTDVQILSGELVKVCQKEVNALKGLIYDKTGFFVGWYFSKGVDEMVSNYALSMFYRQKPLVTLRKGF